MRKIRDYLLYYTPKGNGRVIFRLEGDAQQHSTPPLTANEFSALAVVLAQKRIAYDPVQKTFASFDNDDEENSIAKSNFYV